MQALVCEIVMYQMRYGDVIEESVLGARERESALFKHCIKLLQTARKAGLKTPAALDAVLFTRKLWGALIEDLGQIGNAFPKEMKASLISIGFFILKEIDRLEKGEAINFDAVIEISQSISDGLAAQRTNG